MIENGLKNELIFKRAQKYLKTAQKWLKMAQNVIENGAKMIENGAGSEKYSDKIEETIWNSAVARFARP